MEANGNNEGIELEKSEPAIHHHLEMNDLPEVHPRSRKLTPEEIAQLFQ